MGALVPAPKEHCGRGSGEPLSVGEAKLFCKVFPFAATNEIKAL